MAGQYGRSAMGVPQVLASVLLVAVSLLNSCAPAGKEELQKPALRPNPTDLTADVSGGGAELRWKTNRDDNIPIGGYRIYVSTEPILDPEDDGELPSDLAPLNDSPYPGDTNPAHDFETYSLTGLENGENYYVVVTTIYPDNAESKPSNEIELVPRPEGDFVLRSSFSGKLDGFSFAQQASVATDDLANDIYLAIIAGRLYVASPGRIDNVLRETNFFPLGKRGELENIRVAELKSPGRDKLELKVGEVFILQDADNCFALVKPNRIDGQVGEAAFSFIYQTKPNTIRF